MNYINLLKGQMIVVSMRFWIISRIRVLSKANSLLSIISQKHARGFKKKSTIPRLWNLGKAIKEYLRVSKRAVNPSVL
jgi:hypothetical protein